MTVGQDCILSRQVKNLPHVTCSILSSYPTSSGIGLPFDSANGRFC